MGKNFIIEQLYDMASSKDENGLDQFDEAKLKRELKKGANKNFMRKNKEIFEEEEPKFRTCLRYDPCPVCEKCNNKASHLYVSCVSCNIPICTHDYKTKKRLIIRPNFIQKPSRAVKKAIKEMVSNYEEVSKNSLEKLR